jgi:hypothetical protein
MSTFSYIAQQHKKKKWPTLEVGNFTKGEIAFFVLFYIADLAISWYIFNHDPRAEKFLYPFIVPLILLLFKSRLFFVSTLISMQFAIAFLGIGAPDKVLTATFVLFFCALLFVDIKISFTLFLSSLFVLIIPTSLGFLYEIAAVVLFIVLYNYKINRRELPLFVHSPINTLLFIFSGYCLISAFWTPNFLSSFMDFAQFACVPLFPLLAITILQTEEELEKNLKVFIVFGIGFGLFKLTSPFTGLGTGGMQGATNPDMLQILLSAKNTISSVLNFAFLPTLAVFILNKNLLYRLFLLFGLMCMLMAEWLYGSKGGLGSLGICVFLFFAMIKLRKLELRKWITKGTTISLVFMLIIVIPMVPLVFFKIGEIFPSVLLATSSSVTEGTSLTTLEFRFDQWGYAEEMLADHGNYLTGLGLGGYKYYYSEYVNYEFFQNFMIYAHPHSFWVYTFTDVGLIGMIILHIFLIVFIVKISEALLNTQSIKLRIYGSAIFCAIISFFIHGFVDFAFNETDRLWLFIGLGMAVYKMYTMEINQGKAISINNRRE